MTKAKDHDDPKPHAHAKKIPRDVIEAVARLRNTSPHPYDLHAAALETVLAYIEAQS
jgi:hypothetical protein